MIAESVTRDQEVEQATVAGGAGPVPVQTVCGRAWQVGYVVKPRLVPRHRPAGSSYQSHHVHGQCHGQVVDVLVCARAGPGRRSWPDPPSCRTCAADTPNSASTPRADTASPQRSPNSPPWGDHQMARLGYTSGGSKVMRSSRTMITRPSSATASLTGRGGPSKTSSGTRRN